MVKVLGGVLSALALALVGAAGCSIEPTGSSPGADPGTTARTCALLEMQDVNAAGTGKGHNLTDLEGDVTAMLRGQGLLADEPLVNRGAGESRTTTFTRGEGAVVLVLTLDCTEGALRAVVAYDPEGRLRSSAVDPGDDFTAMVSRTTLEYAGAGELPYAYGDAGQGTVDPLEVSVARSVRTFASLETLAARSDPRLTCEQERVVALAARTGGAPGEVATRDCLIDSVLP